MWIKGRKVASFRQNASPGGKGLGALLQIYHWFALQITNYKLKARKQTIPRLLRGISLKFYIVFLLMPAFAAFVGHFVKTQCSLDWFCKQPLHHDSDPYPTEAGGDAGCGGSDHLLPCLGSPTIRALRRDSCHYSSSWIWCPSFSSSAKAGR